LAEKIQLRTFRLVPSAAWIQTPGSFWLNGTPNGFQVQLDPAILSQAGLHSEKIDAIDESSGKVAFEVPVTVVSPEPLNDSNAHHIVHTGPIRVGESLRYFLDVPAGTTALQLALSSDGPQIWGQLVGPEGNTVTTLKDTTMSSPLTPLSASVNITRPGVYEFDVVAPESGSRVAQLNLSVRAYSLTVTRGATDPGGTFEVTVQNNFESLKFASQVKTQVLIHQQVYELTTDSLVIPFTVSDQDIKNLSRIDFRVITSKKFYDMMTDYPYYILNSKGASVTSGAVELDTHVTLNNLAQMKPDTLNLHIQGSFATAVPKKWAVTVNEAHYLATPVGISDFSSYQLETGQFQTITVHPAKIVGAPAGFKACPTLSLSGADGTPIQYATLCQ
jgi:hypothetical protein